eukprot:GHVT01005343.1.p1 GENE.GHVT01005343.1~~GHVT01005343.1.p1  ORF type:complete len:307 (+),score=52.66 GHVT01005343.1:112-1032(+)
MRLYAFRCPVFVESHSETPSQTPPKQPVFNLPPSNCRLSLGRPSNWTLPRRQGACSQEAHLPQLFEDTDVGYASEEISPRGLGTESPRPFTVCGSPCGPASFKSCPSSRLLRVYPNSASSAWARVGGGQCAAQACVNAEGSSSQPHEESPPRNLARCRASPLVVSARWLAACLVAGKKLDTAQFALSTCWGGETTRADAAVHNQTSHETFTEATASPKRARKNAQTKNASATKGQRLIQVDRDNSIGQVTAAEAPPGLGKPGPADSLRQRADAQNRQAACHGTKRAKAAPKANGRRPARKRPKSSK